MKGKSYMIAEKKEGMKNGISKPINGYRKTTSVEDVSPTHQSHKDPINPFTHKLPLDSFYDYFKLVFMSIFVLPVRVLLIFIILVIGYIFVNIGLMGLSQKELNEKPLTGWRRKNRFLLGFLGRMLMRCYGFERVVVKGRLATRSEAPVLVVGPHSSFLDCIAVYWTDIPGLVSRIENLQLPVFGKCINYTQPVYVWREDTNSRQNTIAAIKERARSRGDWSQIMVFPEGTTTNRSCLITFKPGAFYPGVPVQPIVIRYPNVTDCITWTWDGPGAVKLLWVTLCQFINYCEVECLPVYHPSQEEKDNPKLFANNVRQVMARALNVPVIDYTYDDCRIMHKAKLKNLPCETGLIEFQKLRQIHPNLTLKKVEDELLEDYAEMAGSSGKISLSNFSDYFRLPKTEPSVVELFNFYDKEGSGLISFRNFVDTRCQFAEVAPSEKSVCEAFKFFCKTDEDGRVSSEAFTEVLEASFGLTVNAAAHIFDDVDSDIKGYIDLEDFKAFANRKPDYAQIFVLYQKGVKEGARSKFQANINRDHVLNKKKVE